MQKVIDQVLKAITIAMGVAVVVLSIMGHINMHTGFTLLGLGLACAGILQIRN